MKIWWPSTISNQNLHKLTNELPIETTIKKNRFLAGLATPYIGMFTKFAEMLFAGMRNGREAAADRKSPGGA